MISGREGADDRHRSEEDAGRVRDALERCGILVPAQADRRGIDDDQNRARLIRRIDAQPCEHAVIRVVGLDPPHRAVEVHVALFDVVVIDLARHQPGQPRGDPPRRLCPRALREVRQPFATRCRLVVALDDVLLEVAHAIDHLAPRPGTLLPARFSLMIPGHFAATR